VLIQDPSNSKEFLDLSNEVNKLYDAKRIFSVSE
jgi:hypothetical protein